MTRGIYLKFRYSDDGQEILIGWVNKIQFKIVIAPTAISPPYFNKDELKHTDIILSLACITNVDTPRAKQGNIILLSNFKLVNFIFINVFWPNRKVRIQIH